MFFLLADSRTKGIFSEGTVEVAARSVGEMNEERVKDL